MSAAPEEGTARRRKLKPALAIAVLTVVALVFVSGIVTFAYQMLRAG